MVSAADTKGITMQKLSTAPFRAAKKTERKVGKGKDKETYPGYFSNPLRSARACLRVKRPKPTCSYEYAGAAADEAYPETAAYLAYRASRRNGGAK